MRPGVIKRAAEERSLSLSQCQALSEVVSDQNNRKTLQRDAILEFNKLSNLSVFCDESR